jgi:hypothetical protein
MSRTIILPTRLPVKHDEKRTMAVEPACRQMLKTSCTLCDGFIGLGCHSEPLHVPELRQERVLVIVAAA